MKQTFIYVLCVVIIFFSLNCQHLPKSVPNAEDSNTLETILTKASDYCTQLNESSVSFACRETIKEKRSYSLPQENPKFRPDLWLSRNNLPVGQMSKKGKNVFVFVFRFTRKDYHIEESRTLLEENGLKKHEEDAHIKTKYYSYEDVFFKPIFFFGESFQDDYEYILIKEGNYKGERAYIIGAAPLSSQISNISYGKIWISQFDLSILKMEWEQTSLQNYGEAVIIANSFHALPSFRLSVEFDHRHNGIRFPSSFSFKELYILKQGGKRYIRTDLSVEYSNYEYLNGEAQLAK
jgi:hypothetical protein